LVQAISGKESTAASLVRAQHVRRLRRTTDLRKENSPARGKTPRAGLLYSPSAAAPTGRVPLPRSLTILDNGKEFLRLTALADVRDFLKHIPKERRQFHTWQHVAAELDKAAAGADTASLSIALQMVLMLENVECREK
jgi:hypothetical protein